MEAIPERKAIEARLRALWDYEKFTAPRKEGPNYFYTRNTGLQNQSVVYVTADPAQKGRVLLDPNGLSREGTMALSGMEPSPGGTLLAYAVSSAGSDWQVWRVRDVASGKDLPDAIRWCKFGAVAWTREGTGFFYVNYAAPRKGDLLKGVTKNPKLYFTVIQPEI